MADTNPDANPDEDEYLSSGNSDYDETTEEGLARSRRRDALIGRGVDLQIKKRHDEARSRIPCRRLRDTRIPLRQGPEPERPADRPRAQPPPQPRRPRRPRPRDPDALTLGEAYRAMLWPAPDVVRAKVRHVTDGRVDGPAELFSEAKTGRILTVSECGLLMGRFFSGEMPDWMGELVDANAPGMYEAADLVFARRFYPEGMEALLAPSLVDKDMFAVAMAAVQPLGEPTLPNVESFFSKPPNNPN